MLAITLQVWYNDNIRYERGVNMKQIEKYLKENNIPYSKEGDTVINIVLSEGNIWVNGLGQTLTYDNSLRISVDSYRKYTLIERVGYTQYKKHIQSTKQVDIIKTLSERMG